MNVIAPVSVPVFDCSVSVPICPPAPTAPVTVVVPVPEISVRSSAARPAHRARQRYVPRASCPVVIVVVSVIVSAAMSMSVFVVEIVPAAVVAPATEPNPPAKLRLSSARLPSVTPAVFRKFVSAAIVASSFSATEYGLRKRRQSRSRHVPVERHRARLGPRIRLQRQRSDLSPGSHRSRHRRSARTRDQRKIIRRRPADRARQRYVPRASCPGRDRRRISDRQRRDVDVRVRRRDRTAAVVAPATEPNPPAKLRLSSARLPSVTPARVQEIRVCSNRRILVQRYRVRLRKRRQSRSRHVPVERHRARLGPRIRLQRQRSDLSPRLPPLPSPS